MVLRAADSQYYAFASQTETDSGPINIQVARSRDLIEWEQLRDALPLKPDWAKQTQEFRAPHVVEHDGISYLYYSAKPDPMTVNEVRGGTCLNVAFAEQPEGPYSDQGFPLLCVPGSVNVGPMAFDDPNTGKLLLYWGMGTRFKVRELSSTRVSFAPSSDPIDLIVLPTARDSTGVEPFLEGIWVTYREPYYYLFYTRGTCCGQRAQTAVMVARSRSATGPFEGATEAVGLAGSTALERRDVWVAPGHISIVRDARGDDWIVYHAVDSRRANLKASADINTRRVMLIDPLVYRDGWPRVEAISPSTASGPRSPRR
jgi:arabinan endo-1,5-alpha-L-arabinosidase